MFPALQPVHLSHSHCLRLKPKQLARDNNNAAHEKDGLGRHCTLCASQYCGGCLQQEAPEGCEAQIHTNLFELSTFRWTAACRNTHAFDFTGEPVLILCHQGSRNLHRSLDCPCLQWQFNWPSHAAIDVACQLPVGWSAAQCIVVVGHY